MYYIAFVREKETENMHAHLAIFTRGNTGKVNKTVAANGSAVGGNADSKQGHSRRETS